MRAVLLRWPAAVAVGQRRRDAGEVVLDPFGLSDGRVGVEAQPCALDVDAAALVVVERGAHRGVVERGAQQHVGAKREPPRLPSM